MAVFNYTASVRNREEHIETGTVVAQNEREAKEKLAELDFDNIKLRKLGALASFLKQLTADVR